MEKKYRFSWLTPVAIIIACFHMIPVIITFIVSISKYGEKKSYWKIPYKWEFINYVEAYKIGELGNAFKNTLFITLIVVIAVVLLGSMTAYPLARNKSKFNNNVLNGILAIMMIPSLSVLVPLYTFMVKINGVNTFWGIIIIHITYSLPSCIFLFKNFIESIPIQLDEAALIDGCSIFDIFYRIILPQLKPVIATIIIFTGVGVWNDYANSLYFLQKDSMKTLTLAIAGFFQETSSNTNVAAAAALIAVLPIVIAYIVLQKAFIKGAVDSAIK
ncbi:carbohydrate ABC transporter permease [Enterococcus gallinarum]|uniref:carbohydrate ABC transporter permease n=1 Tax=Enterococcus gallinarum TaxID=1353 RepID=UPI003DA3E129